MSRVIADGLSKKADYKQYGLGDKIFPYALPDLNSLDTPNGWYRVTSSTLNKPSGFGLGIVLIIKADDGPITQYLVSSNNDNIAFSRTNGGIWGSWNKIFHTGNILGTVSQSAGIPTGAVIERGSNANGEYVKFADGTMICRRMLTTPFSPRTAEGSLFIESIDPAATFPVSFASPPVIAFYTHRNVAGDEGVAWVAAPYVRPGEPTATQFSAIVMSAVNTATVGIGYTAVGSWF